jgi:hypothetical protein
VTDNLLEDGNVSQGSAMDVFAMLFVVFILILVLSMVLHGGYRVPENKNFLYLRIYSDDFADSRRDPVLQIGFRDSEAAITNPTYVLNESGKMTPESNTENIRLSVYGVEGKSTGHVFLVEGLDDPGRYTLDVILHDGLEDLIYQESRINVCWQVFAPLMPIRSGCKDVQLEKWKSTLFSIDLDYAPANIP